MAAGAGRNKTLQLYASLGLGGKNILALLLSLQSRSFLVPPAAFALELGESQFAPVTRLTPMMPREAKVSYTLEG